ncbi:hypothetical protein M569_17094 [Genlisea aurea]|uniref:CGL160/ATPI domain-containing protein n=1 Tax=Genlisea aurea TaxID=192259 RepID=S8D4V4_9LAMI|nr:hypothetical protein M569_17094 [Genlisea aurea]
MALGVCHVSEAFLRERKLNGDFVAKVSDMIWFRGVSNSVSAVELDDGGGIHIRAQSPLAEIEEDSESRKKLNFLRYEALKRELFLLTVGVGTACTGYCLVTLSVEAALSYASGVLFSCLYFHLLCQHADNISKESIPEIFTKKKLKKIGFRSEDLRDAFERTIRGSGIALSSPRLVIPGAIYALWEVSQHILRHHVLLDFQQLVPAMLGLFAYKAAALVQVYRDNEDLKLIFPETD